MDLKKYYLFICSFLLIFVSCSDGKLSDNIIGTWKTSQQIAQQDTKSIHFVGYLKFNEDSIEPIKNGGIIHISMKAKQDIVYDSIPFTIEIKITGDGKWKIKDDALSPMIDTSSIHTTYERITPKLNNQQKEVIDGYLSSEAGYKYIDTILTEIEKEFISNFISFDNNYWPDVKIVNDSLSFTTSQGRESYMRCNDLCFNE